MAANRLRLTLFSAVAGALIGLALTALAFIAAVVLGQASGDFLTPLMLIIPLLGGLLGGVIGLAVGAFDLGPPGGALAGAAATLVLGVVYIPLVGPTSRDDFLSLSAAVVLVLGLPTVLTGVVTAAIQKQLRARRHV